MQCFQHFRCPHRSSLNSIQLMLAFRLKNASVEGGQNSIWFLQGNRCECMIRPFKFPYLVCFNLPCIPGELKGVEMIKSTNQVSCFYSSKAFTYKLNWNQKQIISPWRFAQTKDWVISLGSSIATAVLHTFAYFYQQVKSKVLLMC